MVVPAVPWFGWYCYYAATALSVAEDADVLMQKGAVLQSDVGVGGVGYMEAVDVNWGSASGPAPIGTGTAIEDPDAIPAGWVGFTAPPKPKPTPVQPQPTPSCPAIFFVGARGSGEYTNETEPYGENEQFKLLGRKLDWAEKAVEKAIEPAKVAPVAVEYPALGFFSSNKTHDVLVLASIVDDEYYDNLWEGADATEEVFPSKRHAVRKQSLSSPATRLARLRSTRLCRTRPTAKSSRRLPQCFCLPIRRNWVEARNRT